jgi:hypothetical protein
MGGFKGTKGKWIFRETVTSSVNGVEKISVFSENDYGFYSKSICRIDVEDFKIAEADAKLIACSPEMLEMLIRAEQWIENCGEGSRIAKEIKSLIKKATL